MGGITKLNSNEPECQITNHYTRFEIQNVISIHGKSAEEEVQNFEMPENDDQAHLYLSKRMNDLLACHPTELSIPIVEDSEGIDNQPVKDEHKSTPFNQIFEDFGIETSGNEREIEDLKYEMNPDISNDKQIVHVESVRNLCASPQDLSLSAENCPICGNFIGNKLEECQIQLEILKIEKKRLLAFEKHLTKEKEIMDYRQQQTEEEIHDLRLELEKEKKRIIAKEINEKPRRAQHKKEMREMTNMKIELDEIKKQMNERVAKNAACIANLRNHIKILEKNNNKLQNENEKLQHENTKLNDDLKNNNKSTEILIPKQIRKKVCKSTEKECQHQCSEVDMTCKPQNLVTEPKETIEKEHSIEEKYNNMFREPKIEETNYTCNINDRLKSFRELGKTETMLENGSREIRYTNGNKKIISQDCIIRQYYANNDIWHINFPDGTEVIEFPNGQCEKRYKDGKCLIFFPDGLIQIIFPNGTEQLKYPDGTKILTNKEGDRMLFSPTGQVEIHTKNHKTREYPDGTVKISYADGSQEKKYSNGRIKIKNSKGDIILDTGER